MRILLLVIVVVIVTTACQPKKEAASSGPVLTLKWQTEPQLTTCESVIYDKVSGVLYVSNIDGTPDVKDGNGFISAVNLDGTIQSLKWVTGMDAPKGLGIVGGKLYATDIDKIIEIDIATAKISNTYPVPDSKFLNDITTDDAGNVYASDSNTGNIFLLRNGKVSKWTSGISGPNGLLAEGGKMLMLAWNEKTFNSIDTASKQIVMVADSLENPDGIEAVGDGGYLVSSWNGQVNYVDPSGKTLRILDTRADSIGAADIEYIPEKNLLLVPTFYKNKLAAYELTKPE